MSADPFTSVMLQDHFFKQKLNRKSSMYIKICRIHFKNETIISHQPSVFINQVANFI